MWTRETPLKGHDHRRDGAQDPAATPQRAIVSSDAGVFLLPPPVEAFREFMVLLESAGFSEEEIRTMNSTNPGELFRIRGAPVQSV